MNTNRYEKISDQELILLLKMKNEGAYTEIYVRHWHSLYLHAYKILENEEEAKDVIQELFITLWDKSDHLEIKTNLRAYLYVSARHRILNRIRKNKIGTAFIDTIAESLNDIDNSTIEAISERELMTIIDEEINLLPPRMKQVFEMSRKEMMSNKEIAARLGTSESTIKKQISNSIKQLRTNLDKYSLSLGIVLSEIVRKL
ncbi:MULTISPECIES: RNA polymerase sigma factor [Sphingobacterium]|uniref:RNA polymerase sigma factor n=1 Tax=Sphingobacterium TaxID=28453 RepID=UPI0013D9DD06|nr:MULTISPECIES: RNA polymerase sigma-70 factor [unclassified Sphingobacterium]